MTAALETLHEKYPDKIAFYNLGTVEADFGVAPYYVNGQEAKHQVYDPKYKEMLLWMNELAIKGILTKDSFIDDSTVARVKVIKGIPIVLHWTLGEAGRVVDDGTTSYEPLDPCT